MNPTTKPTKGPYEIGEYGQYPCGCYWEKTEEGFNHYVDKKCEFDNSSRPKITGYNYYPYYAFRNWGK